MSQQIDCHIYHRVLPQSIPQRLWPRGTLLQTTITKSILWTVNRVQLEMSYSKFECIFELFKLRLQWENPFCNRSKIMSFYDHRAYCCIERSEPFNNTLLLKNTKKCYSSGIRSWTPGPIEHLTDCAITNCAILIKTKCWQDNFITLINYVYLFITLNIAGWDINKHFFFNDAFRAIGDFDLHLALVNTKKRH